MGFWEVFLLEEETFASHRSSDQRKEKLKEWEGSEKGIWAVMSF